MGIFASIFGAGKAQRANREAGEQIDTGYQSAFDRLSPLNNTTALDAATQGAGNRLSQGYNAARGRFQALDDNSALDAATRNAAANFRRGGDTTQLRADMGRAEEVYQPYMATAGQDFANYRDAIGSGNSQDAIARFQGSPDYILNNKAGNDAAMQAVQAQFGSAGMGRSGRAMLAMQEKATELSNRNFGNYTAGLTGAVDRQLGVAGNVSRLRADTAGRAAAMQSGMYGSLADLGVNSARFNTTRADNNTMTRQRALADLDAQEGASRSAFDVGAARYGDERARTLTGSLADLDLARANAKAQITNNKGQISVAKWQGLDNLIGGGLRLAGNIMGARV